MTRSTLNSRSRKVSSADADANSAAKKSSERITGEVTKEPKEQLSPPLFCVWGRSVEKYEKFLPSLGNLSIKNRLRDRFSCPKSRQVTGQRFSGPNLRQESRTGF